MCCAAVAVVDTLTQLSCNTVAFSLVKFLQGTITSDAEYTEDVWATIDAAFSILLDSTLIAVGNPKRTYQEFRKGAQLDRKLQQLVLLQSLC